MIRLISLILFLACGCNVEEFGTKYSQTSDASSPTQILSNYSCAAHHTEKPKIDYLFLWDNSSSTRFINSETKLALNNTINQISERFDYRILLTPLINYPDPNYFLITENNDGLDSYALGLKIDKSQAASKLDQFMLTDYESEKGMERAISYLNTNISHGIFRPYAHLVVVIMSNGDDTTIPDSWGPAKKIEYATQQASSLKDIAQNALHAPQLHFFAIVPFSACQTGYKQNIIYKKVSEIIASDLPETPIETFDICTVSYPTGFANIFSPLNSVQDIIIPHTYRYWPVMDPGAPPIDPSSIVVTKVNEDLSQVIIPPYSTTQPNGFSYLNEVRTVNTRILPTVGEAFTGYSVELHGTARVEYPSCLNITYETMTFHYGYVYLDPSKGYPNLSTLVLKINGQTIPQDDTNGWSWYGQYDNLSITIAGPGDYSASTPATYRTGYFLRLNGDAVYTSGGVVEVTYLPMIQ